MNISINGQDIKDMENAIAQYDKKEKVLDCVRKCAEPLRAIQLMRGFEVRLSKDGIKVDGEFGHKHNVALIPLIKEFASQIAIVEYINEILAGRDLLIYVPYDNGKLTVTVPIR